MKERITKEKALEILRNMNVSADFLFGKLMKNPEDSRIVLSTLLERDIGAVKEVVPQNVLKHYYEGKGVRLDIKVVNEKEEIYNAEMENKNIALAKRSRYYQSVIDADNINPGEDYGSLKVSYVIFICTFDPFGYGLHRYTFLNKCKEVSGLELNDETYKIFFYTDSEAEDISQEARELLHYFTHSTASVANSSKCDAVRKIHNRVSKIKTDDAVGGEFLTTLYHDFDVRWEGRQEGENLRLIKQICKKLRKSKSPEVIADEVEEDLNLVEQICNIAKDYAPDYDEKKVFEAVSKTIIIQ